MNLLRNISLGLAVCCAAVAAAAPDLPTRTVNGKEYYCYEVPSKATIYSLTRLLGYTRDEIIRHNPQVRDGLRAGDVLLFPVETAAAESDQSDLSDLSDKSDLSDLSDESDRSLNVAVMLPFMLEAENMTRQAENQTNFYRGMLLAVNDLAAKSDLKPNIHAYDTAALPDTVAAIVSRPEFAAMDYVIAPGDSLSLEYICRTTDSTDAAVLNLFAVKNEAYTRHESLLQANIPRDEMYKMAIGAFCSEFADTKAIILHPTDIPADKKEFVDELTEAMVAAGIPYEEVQFAGRLEPELLGELPERNYVFVPTGSSREVMMRILPTLVAYSEASPAHNMRLFGYPEWVTMRGEIKESLHKLNALIYSRFSTDLDSEEARGVAESYRRWFGTDLPQTVPNTVLLGYDTMAWILSAAANGLTEPYEGLQNSFKVKELGAPAGDVNLGLYLISFAPDGKVKATAL